VVGCLFRCAACLVQVLYALNERYFVNEKGSARAADSFPFHPAGFGEILDRPGPAQGQRDGAQHERPAL